MQKDRLSSTHTRRLSLHVITLGRGGRKGGWRKKKKIRNTHYWEQFHQLLNVTGQSWITQSCSLPRQQQETSRAVTTSWKSISGKMLTTETRQIIRWLVCAELCDTVATLLYCIWLNEQKRWVCLQESFLNWTVRGLFIPTSEWKQRKEEGRQWHLQVAAFSNHIQENTFP